MVEFAFFFLLFLALIVGLMEMGRAVWTFTTIAHAARQGARFAMVHGGTNTVVDGNGNDITGSEIEAVVKANAVGVDPDLLSVTSTWAPDNSRGSLVQVQVTYPFQFVASPLFLAVDSLQLGSVSEMVVAN